MEEYHIGKEIEKEVRKQYPSIDAFAKALHRERQTVYDIFKRAHIATDRLLEVSRLLNRDFFKDFSNVLHFGETPEEEYETEVAECISQLMPEDELQVIKAVRLHELIDEFFLSERKKPMVIIHDDNYSIVADFRKVAENIFGNGMVKSITIRQEDIFAFEVGKILGKALFGLSTYQFDFVQLDDDTTRFYANTVSATPEENSLLDECHITPRLTMWFDVSKSTGKFTAGGESFGDHVPSFEINGDNMWAYMAKGEFNLNNSY